MGNIKSELLKYKRSMEKKILIITTIVAVLLGFFQAYNPEVVNANLMFTYNCWYVFLFAFLVAWIPGSNIAKEKKYCYHGMFSVVKDKKKIWMGKLGAAYILLFGASILFAVLACGQRWLYAYSTFSMKTLFVASIVIFFTFAWQVPVYMMLTQKLNIYVATVVSILGNFILGVCTLAVKSVWWLPYGITPRLMCPMLEMLPSGELIDIKSELSDSRVIVPGLIISLAYLVVTIFATTIIFDKEEI